MEDGGWRSRPLFAILDSPSSILSSFNGAEAHGLAGIDDAEEMQVGFFEVLLEINLVGFTVLFPIDMADVIAGDIRAMLGKLDGDALVGRAVHAAGQAFDDETGAEVDGADARERSRVEVFAIVGDGFGHL